MRRGVMVAGYIPMVTRSPMNSVLVPTVLIQPSAMVQVESPESIGRRFREPTLSTKTVDFIGIGVLMALPRVWDTL